jgi:hypothetical protein
MAVRCVLAPAIEHEAEHGDNGHGSKLYGWRETFVGPNGDVMCADSDLSGEVDGMCGEEFGRLLDTDLRRNRPHRGSEALHRILGFEDVENEEAVRPLPSGVNQ